MIPIKYDLPDPDKAAPVKITHRDSTGWDEAYREWFKCPKCKETEISIYSNYCPNCGVAIQFSQSIRRAK